MDSHYVITRGVKPGKNLTNAQRSSSKFSEEPVVLGKVLRSRSLPMKLSEEQFMANIKELMRLNNAGAICIQYPKLPEKPAESPSQPPENQMGSSSLVHGGTPNVVPAETVPPVNAPVLTTPEVVEEPKVVAPAELKGIPDDTPNTTEPALKELPDVPVEADIKVVKKGKKA